MRRRDVFALVGVAAALPLGGRAGRAEKTRRVGVLIPTSPDGGEAILAAVRDELRKLGWAEGRDLQLDIRYAQDNDPQGKVGAELLALGPEAILVGGAPVLALHKLTRRVPIVFASFYDPVGAGLAESLAHPGGNVTGFPQPDTPVIAKELQLLKELVPQMTRALVLVGGTNYPASWQSAAERAERSLGLRISPARIHDAASIKDAIRAFAAAPGGGMISLPSGVTGANRQLIVALAARYRLPAIYPSRVYCDLGGLMSYGVDFLALYRRAAGYVDRILKGAKPGDLPIEQPARFELVVNLKTAKALGLSVPPLILAQADEVIE